MNTAISQLSSTTVIEQTTSANETHQFHGKTIAYYTEVYAVIFTSILVLVLISEAFFFGN